MLTKLFLLDVSCLPSDILNNCADGGDSINNAVEYDQSPLTSTIILSLTSVERLKVVNSIFFGISFPEFIFGNAAAIQNKYIT